MQSRIDRPSPTTVRTVAWISVVFVVILALVEVYCATVLAPRLPANFEIAVTGQRQSGVIDSTPGGLALFGYLFAGAAFVAAITGVGRGCGDRLPRGLLRAASEAGAGCRRGRELKSGSLIVSWGYALMDAGGDAPLRSGTTSLRS